MHVSWPGLTDFITREVNYFSEEMGWILQGYLVRGSGYGESAGWFKGRREEKPYLPAVDTRSWFRMGIREGVLGVL